MTLIPSITCEEEKALIVECMSGDADAWVRFERQYGRLVRAVVRSALKGRNAGIEAEEAVNQVFERLMEDNGRRVGAWRGESRFSTYLTLVTRHLLADHVRYQRRFERVRARYLANADVPVATVLSFSGADSSGGSSLARLSRFREAIETLSPKQRMILQLRLNGLTLRQVAQTMQVPEGTVFADNSRAIERIRAVVTAEGPSS